MSTTDALAFVNAQKEGLARLVRGVIRALDDGHVSTWEGIAMGQMAVNVGVGFVAQLEQMSPGDIKDVLFVLENGTFML